MEEKGFWYRLHDSFYQFHLYPKKGEAAFKIFCITICCFAGLHMYEDGETLDNNICSSFLLFSISIVMEYIGLLLSAKKLIPKVLPFILCVANGFIITSTLCFLSNHPIKWVEYMHLRTVTFISWLVILLDVLTMVLFEPPQSSNIENGLKQIKLDY